MSESNHPKPTRLSPSGAISLALALGLVCTVAGVAVTGYITGYLDGVRSLQFTWLLILFFGVPGGFVVLSEFTPRAFLKLRVVKWAKLISAWGYRSFFATSAIGFLVIPEWMISAFKWVFIIPGPALIGLALLEKYAMNIDNSD
ncbi:hypothetical protein [Tateyamaria sp.]|uniref:hypothetical protein n=1 Tax=Tateyamaria sp. TaxID=1929288 RepID=UPI003B2238FA